MINNNDNYINLCRFALTLACLIGYVAAFTPSAFRSTRSTVLMAAERSKSLPFMLKPAKVWYIL